MLSDMSNETSTKGWQCYIIMHLIFTKYLITTNFTTNDLKNDMTINIIGWIPYKRMDKFSCNFGLQPCSIKYKVLLILKI